jgi:hypothetical protein
VAIPKSGIATTGQPSPHRIRINKIEVSIGDYQSLCGGAVVAGSLNPHSGGYPSGPELDPISVSGGYPVYDFFGPIPFTMGVQCPDEADVAFCTDVAAAMIFAYVAPELKVANTWLTRDPVAFNDDAIRGDYLFLEVDPVYKRGYCGIEQPFSGRVWRKVFNQPIIIGSGQALHVGFSCLPLVTGNVSVYSFIRAHVTALVG